MLDLQVTRGSGINGIADRGCLYGGVVMPYLEVNIKTKKALKEAVASGKKIGVFQPNNIFGVEFYPNQKGVAIEMPWGYHKAYCTVDLDENKHIIKVR